MNQDDALRIAQTSMKVNKHLLRSLGDEKKINLKQNPDEDIIKILTDLMPKSTEGKILALGAALLFAYIILKK